ncbi:MAG: hypothetical protein GY801_42180 [bacterium]|nr:hypothetical protein [bacterium]
MNKEQRLRQKIDELGQQWELVSEKLSRLREAKAIETDAARTFQLEKQIEPLEADVKRLEEQLDDLETQLQDLPQIQPASKTGQKTMTLSADLNKKIVEFLTSIPNSYDSNAQRALMLNAGLDPQLQNQIHFGGPPAQFFQLLLATLVSYGRLQDGRDALEAVLETAKSSVGRDKQDDCDRLLREWRMGDRNRQEGSPTEALRTETASTRPANAVPGHKYDIAVSYAHIDDHPSYGAEEGWVITLIKTLKIQLAQKLGSQDAYTLWSDHQQPGNIPISDMLPIFRDAALLVVVLSPGYVMSEWCQRQQNNFLHDVQNRVRSGSRVFVVERDRIEAGESPLEFSDLRGYPFWVRDREGRPPRVLTPQRDTGPYFDMLNDLSYDLAQELRKLKIGS